MGESFIVNEKNVGFGVKSVLNILSFLEMVEPVEGYFSHDIAKKFESKIYRFSNQPVSSTSGVIRFLAKPEDVVKKGQKIAKIYNPFGKLQESITALDSGIVLGHSDSSVAFPGAHVMAFALLED